MTKGPDNVVIHSWLEVLWHKRTSVVVALGCFAFAGISLLLGNPEVETFGGKLLLYAIPIAVGLITSGEVIAWGYSHIQNRDRADINYFRGHK